LFTNEVLFDMLFFCFLKIVQFFDQGISDSLHFKTHVFLCGVITLQYILQNLGLTPILFEVLQKLERLRLWIVLLDQLLLFHLLFWISMYNNTHNTIGTTIPNKQSEFIAFVAQATIRGWLDSAVFAHVHSRRGYRRNSLRHVGWWSCSIRRFTSPSLST
jgi:hypothetical protein